MIGCLRNFSEQLQWASAYDGFTEMLHNLKEVGSLIFWMSLLDTAMVITPFFAECSNYCSKATCRVDYVKHLITLKRIFEHIFPSTTVSNLYRGHGPSEAN